MKILLASFLYEAEIGGGASAVLNQLAQMLTWHDHHVIVLTTWAGHQIKTENVAGMKIIRLPASNLYWVADKDRQPMYKKISWQLFDIWNPLIYLLAREIIKNEVPDVVHSHKLRGLSPSIWSAASSAGIKKIVHTCHDFELLSPEGLLMGRVGKLAREQSLVIRPYQSVRRYFSRLVHHAIAPSRYVMDLHQKMKFFPLASTKIIPNTHGLRVADLIRKSLEIARARRFLCIGRLDKAKGIEVLCQAFSQISDKQDLSLTIAGWGPLDASLRETYRDKSNIEFVGAVFGAQKDELFTKSDVLVSPSLAPESFGLVIAEAYSHGLPVIASRVGAYPEIVRDGETGLLVEPGSVDALISAISSMSADLKMFQAMSVACSQEARRFTSEAFIREYQQIYEGK